MVKKVQNEVNKEQALLPKPLKRGFWARGKGQKNTKKRKVLPFTEMRKFGTMYMKEIYPK